MLLFAMYYNSWLATRRTAHISELSRSQMRKAKPVRDLRTFEEILDDELRSAIVLHQHRTRAGTLTALQRRQLLDIYADIAKTGAGKGLLQTFKEAAAYYDMYSFPGLIAKSFLDGELTRPVEVYLPLVFSARRLSRLLVLFDAWNSRDVETLRQALVACDCNRQSLDHAIERNVQAGKHRAANQRLIKYVLERDKEKNHTYRRGINDPGDNADVVKILVPKRKFHFRGVNFAFHQPVNDDFQPPLSEIHIPPFEGALFPADEDVLLCAKDQLLKAANIMLQGIQPRIVEGPTRSLIVSYHMRCDWHEIATAFAELLTGMSCEIRRCQVKKCGREISHLRAGAQKCTECSDKKRR